MIGKNDREGLLKTDRAHLWHPYTRFSTFDSEPLPIITRGEGIYLFDADGKRYVDAIASWWACSLGHSHPRIIAAIRKQTETLQHSILGNLSHPPAIELAKRLAHLMPDPKRHVLFSSDGASAVEAALKIALQYAHNIGKPKRTRFVSIEEAYHGDTLGAVGVGYLEAFHRPLKPALATAIRYPLPGPDDDPAPLLDAHRDEIAAVIVEPLCLGAAGMKMYPAAWLRRLWEACRAREIPLIIDEIAMGFGRTGRMFAFEHAGIDPDMVCVGKGVTSGYLPLSAVIARDDIYRTFSDTPADHTFYHGHTWSGNPVAAAAAVETLSIYDEERIVDQAERAGVLLKDLMQPITTLPHVREVRCLGLIAAVELEMDDATPTRPRRVQHRMRDAGYLLRPLGPVVYLMPPLVIPQNALRDMVAALTDSIRTAGLLSGVE